jgi:hypothetical protein
MHQTLTSVPQQNQAMLSGALLIPIAEAWKDEGSPVQVVLS